MKILGTRKPVELRKPLFETLDALVMSGGGANGAWQAGVLSFLSELGKYQKGFEIVSGTSVGSLNGVGVAHYRPDEFAKAAAFVLSIWQDMVKSSSDIYEYRWPKWITGAWNTSLAKSDPVLKLLRSVVDETAVKDSGIKIRFPSVDLMSGKMKVWNEETPDLIAGIMASSSFPIVFPLVEYDGKLLTDGGIRDIAPVRQAIKAGATSLLVLHTGYSSPLTKAPTNVADVALRILDIMADEVLKNDIEDAQKMNKRIEKAPSLKNLGYRKIPMKVLGPSEDLGDSLDFSKKLTDQRIELGREDAKSAFA